MKKMLLILLLVPVITSAQSMMSELNSAQNIAWYNTHFKLFEDSVAYYQKQMRLPQIPAKRKADLQRYTNSLALYRNHLRAFVLLHQGEEQAAKALLTSCIRAIEINADTLRALASILKDEGRDNKYAQYLKQELQGRENNKVGKIFIPFSMPNADGQIISSDKYQGKYRLILFWASWCIPCRAEIPRLLVAYHQLKSKNLTVLAVSVDTKKTNWLHAIAQDKTDWINLFDNNGWESPVVRNYAIHRIPQNILVNPEGKIIAKNISVAGLVKLLEK